MKTKFSAEQFLRIIDQSLTYECACPAQVCRLISEMRDLHAYQKYCADDDATNRAVHVAIAEATERSHAIMEDCLEKLLVAEGWDLATLTMPGSLRKKLKKPV